MRDVLVLLAMPLAPERRAPLCSDSVCTSPKTLPACLAVE